MPLPPTGSVKPQKNTWGGFQSATFYSGAVVPGLTGAPGAVATGSDVLVFSGAGRLDTVLVHQHTGHSGALLPIVFYDAATAVSGGPIYTSGHKLVAFAPLLVNLLSGALPVSGQNSAYAPPGLPQQVSWPFLSGLCFNSRSGQPGFSVAWTAEPFQA